MNAVCLYPTVAWRDESSERKWRVRIHGWIFKPRDIEYESVAAVAGLVRFYKIRPRSAEHEVFLRRIQNFVFKNRRGATVMLRCCDPSSGEESSWDAENECGVALLTSTTSNRFGHFEREEIVHECELPPAVAASERAPVAINVRNVEPLEPGRGMATRDFEGTVFFVPPTGVSVVSDIDDTVKVTEVLERDKLIRNTFMREFTVVPGMERLYQEWASEGAAFHYVSSSPWQLQPEIAAFFAKCGLPGGSFHLRDFDIRNRNFFKYFFTKSTKSKPLIIENLLECFPARQFVLVGDCGEKDPEIYAALARKHRDQITHVFLRRIPKDGRDLESLKALFDFGGASEVLTVFADPDRDLVGPARKIGAVV